VKHGIKTFWRRRVLSRDDAWIAGLTRDYEDQLIADLGGEEMVTAGQRRMMEIARAARTCWLLALSKGKDGELSKDAARFMAIEQKGLVALGLERRARPVPSLSETLARLQAEASNGNGHVVEEPSSPLETQSQADGDGSP
jgi:hypothetical protein